MQLSTSQKMVWLSIGLVAGIAICQFWPHETVQAATSDRSENFAVITVPTGSSFGAVETVFVLDFLTGQLVGATMDPQAAIFTRFYTRNVAIDFGLRPRSKPKYAISAGMMPFSNVGRNSNANGVIYVAELSSGRVGAYTYPYAEAQKVLPPMPVVPLDHFSFREVAPAE